MSNQKHKPKILDIGCGFRKAKDAVGIDILPQSEADIIWNLNKFPWPVPDNEFDVIIAQDILEHLEDIPRVMEEVHRLAKPGARLIIRVPHFSSFDAFTDPTHKHFFSSCSFDYFIPGTKYYQKYRQSQVRFSKEKIFLGPENPRVFTPLWLLRNCCRGFYERHLAFIFPIDSINLKLKVIK
jgi:SAM-dependent methyltransferase